MLAQWLDTNKKILGWLISIEMSWHNRLKKVTSSEKRKFLIAPVLLWIEFIFHCQIAIVHIRSYFLISVKYYCGYPKWKCMLCLVALSACVIVGLTEKQKRTWKIASQNCTLPTKVLHLVIELIEQIDWVDWLLCGVVTRILFSGSQLSTYPQRYVLLFSSPGDSKWGSVVPALCFMLCRHGVGVVCLFCAARCSVGGR